MPAQRGAPAEVTRTTNGASGKEPGRHRGLEGDQREAPDVVLRRSQLHQRHAAERQNSTGSNQTFSTEEENSLVKQTNKKGRKRKKGKKKTRHESSDIPTLKGVIFQNRAG